MSAARVVVVAGALLALAGLAWLWNGTRAGRGGGAAEVEGREAEVATDPVELVPAGRVADTGRDAAPRASEVATGAAENASLAAEPAIDAPRHVIVHVRDRASGRELPSVLAVVLDGHFDASVVRPGAAGERRAEELGPSPLRLESPEPGELSTLFARGPGHAWGSVWLDVRSREVELELDAGGGLLVAVTGGPRDPGTRVRVLGADRAALAESELHGADELEIAGLPEGPVEVAAQVGGSEWPRELAREPAEIVAGTTASVTLALEPVEAARWVPLAGTLVVPPEWGLEFFLLSFELQGTPLERWDGRPVVSRVEMTLADAEAGLYLWDARDVQPGTYSVVLAELGFEQAIEVGSQGARDVSLRVDPPCDVRLRCVDAASGEPQRVFVLWSSAGARGAQVTVPPEGWNDELRRWEFRAPQGEIDVVALHDELEARRFALRPGPNELEMELGAPLSMGLRVRFVGLHGERWPPQPALEPLEPQQGNAAESRWSYELSAENGVFGPTALVLRAERPGRHRMSVPPIAGYEPVPERVVEIARGAVTEVVVELERRR